MTSAPPRLQRVTLVVNPSKVNAHLAPARVAEACQAAGWPTPRVLETTIAEPGAAQARAALDEGADLVLAAGGDGTVREVASVLAGTGLPLGLLPLGTGNLLARNLDIRPGRTEANLRTALFGIDHHIDIARAEITRETGTSSHSFLVMAGIGLDARVVGATREVLKRRLGWLAYGEATVRHLLHRPSPIALAIDAEPEATHLAQSVLVGNCGQIPAGIRFIPGARVDDGVLDVVIVAPATPFGWVPIAGQVLLRSTKPRRDLQYHPARTIVLRPSAPSPMQLDGDVLLNVTAATIRVDPHALRVRLPAPGQTTAKGIRQP